MNRAALGLLQRFGKRGQNVRDAGSVFPIRQLVAELLGTNSTTVLDIGARDSSPTAWWRLDPIASLVGFELDPMECEKLNRQSASPNTARFVPIALGEFNGRVTLYQTRQSACASVFRPLENLGKIYPPLAAMECVSTTEVELQKLDDWWLSEDRPHVSFLKLDTQGSELGILKGGLGPLSTALGCEIEVEFSPIYQGQPLFSDVDAFMRSQGFAFWQLRDPCSYSAGDGNAGSSGRLFWANAVYFREPFSIRPSETNWNRLLILAALLEAAGDKTAGQRCLSYLFEGMTLPAGNPEKTVEATR